MSEYKKNIITTTLIILFTFLLSTILVKKIPSMPVISDSEDYHTIAVSIIEGNGYPAVANKTLLIYPPFYPLLITAIYILTSIGSYVSIYFIQYIIVGLTSIVLFFILRNFAKAPFLLSLFSSLCVLFWPYLILYSQLVSSEVLYTFLLLFFFFLFFGIKKDSSVWMVLATGVILGVTILTRPVALLLFPWILIALFLISKIPQLFVVPEIPWKKYFLILIISLATLLPWEFYVYKHYQEIIPVASNLGNVFSKANKTFEYLPETEKPSILKAKIKNLYLFWDPGADGYHVDIVKEKYPALSFGILLYKILFFIILFTAGVTSVVCRKNRLVLYSVITITYTWAVHTVLFPFPRYTLPIMPFVIIVAVIGIIHLSKILNKNNENTSSHPIS